MPDERWDVRSYFALASSFSCHCCQCASCMTAWHGVISVQDAIADARDQKGAAASQINADPYGFGQRLSCVPLRGCYQLLEHASLLVSLLVSYNRASRMIIGNYTADDSVGETAPSPISPSPGAGRTPSVAPRRRRRPRACHVSEGESPGWA